MDVSLVEKAGRIGRRYGTDVQECLRRRFSTDDLDECVSIHPYLRATREKRETGEEGAPPVVDRGRDAGEMSGRCRA
ncbi:hypothetical protein FHS43_005234 [Streptosporangium becharense]|uniref:Uncharacterized protein n=1 Tax=Streptosporangium becharense TaxID=1816182 RepID=A0A7W9MID3_9ACTN|nr:hypothetical protein [Streptosporangium becharense]MBB2913925.1 hypothetical protein [Streptosporangium becharense]MBB5821413.1 hypothetical protein [Streptosporangium becharense]